MNKIVILAIVLITLLLANCKSAQNSNNINTTLAKSENKPAQVPKREINYTFPDDSLKMSDSAKAEFVKNFDKGQILYGIVCAKCHNKLVDGKEVVPDFSLPQLMDYEMRVQYPSHEGRLTEANLSVLELDHVVDYLRYKKKSGVHF
jgi:outer membrane murein-binding lipoprotein Lpp